jgi:hypothetical protein
MLSRETRVNLASLGLDGPRIQLAKTGVYTHWPRQPRQRVLSVIEIFRQLFIPGGVNVTDTAATQALLSNR